MKATSAQPGGSWNNIIIVYKDDLYDLFCEGLRSDPHSSQKQLQTKMHNNPIIFNLILTGYIPRMPFKFGNTYKEDCDVCIDDFLSNTHKRDNEIKDIKTTVIGTRRLRPVASNKHTKISLNEYRDRNPT